MDKTKLTSGIVKIIVGGLATAVGTGLIHVGPEWLAFLVALQGFFGGADNIKTAANGHLS